MVKFQKKTAEDLTHILSLDEGDMFDEDGGPNDMIYLLENPSSSHEPGSVSERSFE